MWRDRGWRFRRVAAATIVVALHAAVLYYVLAPKPERMTPVLTSQPSLEVMLYTEVRSPRVESRPASAHRPLALPIARRTKKHPVRTHIALETPSRPPRRKRNVHAWMHWENALTREIRVTQSRWRRKSHRLRFGFPKSSSAAPSPRHEWDGWDYAATHRIEELPQGGTVINLNDRCVLLINPFPLFGCAIGHIPAKGDLFKHLHDDRDEPPNALP